MLPSRTDITAFIENWGRSGASERANFQPFIVALCDLLEIPSPDPATPNERENAYVFDKRVPRHRDNQADTTAFMDLYRRGSFVMEAKQGSEGGDDTPLFGRVGAPGRSGHGARGSTPWQTALQKAKNQAERYVRDLPAYEGRPPFIVVVDVGYSFDLYSEFTRTGGSYVPYPDPQSHRILLEDLHDEDVRERLRALWLDPLSLDPSRRSEQVTRRLRSAWRSSRDRSKPTGTIRTSWRAS